MSRFFVSFDELRDHFEQQRIYNQRNKNRWEDGLRHSGIVSGIQGKQSQLTCKIKMATHFGAEQAYEDAIKALDELVSIDAAPAFFGDPQAAKLLGPWGDEAVLIVKLGGERNFDGGLRQIVGDPGIPAGEAARRMQSIINREPRSHQQGIASTDGEMVFVTPDPEF